MKLKSIIANFKILYVSTLVTCIILNIPFFFDTEPFSRMVNITNSTDTFILYEFRPSEFNASRLGLIIRIIIFIIRNILMIFDILLSFISLYYFKKILKNKRLLTNLANINKSTKYITGQNSKAKQRRFNKTEINAQMMVVVICILSILEQCSLTITDISFYLKQETTFSRVVPIISSFSIAIKHFSNFLIFYVFNKSFKEKINNYFQ